VVNGKAIAQFDQRIAIDDLIEVLPKGSSRVVKRKKGALDILFKDDDIVVINKPIGLLSVASSSEKHKHALEMLRKQLSTKRTEVKLETGRQHHIRAHMEWLGHPTLSEIEQISEKLS